MEVEWRYPAQKGECLYCAESGKTIRDFVGELAQGLEAESVKVTFTENPSTRTDTSPLLLINDTPLEEVLEGETIVTGGCPTCTPAIGKKVRFLRTLHYRDKTYLEVPEKVVQQAIRKMADLE